MPAPSSSSAPRRRATAAKPAPRYPALEHLIHLALLNREVLITPFHNMMLVCPATTRAQVAQLVAAFTEITAQLAG